jgi:hypothetical protein
MQNSDNFDLLTPGEIENVMLSDGVFSEAWKKFILRPDKRGMLNQQMTSLLNHLDIFVGLRTSPRLICVIVNVS